MNKLFVSASILALSLAACDQAEEVEPVDEAALEEGALDDPLAEGALEGDLDMLTEEFVDDISAANQYEIDAAQLALENTQDPQLRTFAQMMLDDHRAAADAMMQAAQAAPVPITIAVEPTEQTRDWMNALQAEEPADWDELYVSQQVDAHQLVLDRLRQYAEEGEVAPLREWAATTVPTIERHMEMAQELHGEQE